MKFKQQEDGTWSLNMTAQQVSDLMSVVGMVSDRTGRETFDKMYVLFDTNKFRPTTTPWVEDDPLRGWANPDGYDPLHMVIFE